MATLTGKQAGKLIALFADTPSEHVQELFASGLLADVRDGNIEHVDREEFRRLLGLKPLNPPLLDVIGTHFVSATTEPFVANQKFKLEKDGGICSRLGENFKTWFLGKTEAIKGDTTLRCANLTRNSLDRPILDELGDLAETTLVELFTMMEDIIAGKEGNLLVNRCANIFYIRDADNLLRGVIVLWHIKGWLVDARSLEHPGVEKSSGLRVFSRNS